MAGAMPANESDDKTHPLRPVERLRTLWPDLRLILAPRRGLLIGGLVLVFINRASGLVLPASTKFLIDDIIGRGRVEWLPWLVASVALAALVQAVTSFGLTQLLGKAAHRLIADWRQRLQVHVGRLPVSYFDANKTGTLVSRILNDVDGLRSLLGMGLVNFVGALSTAALAVGLMAWISFPMTATAAAALCLFSFVLRGAMGGIRPAVRERNRILGELTGRLAESLGGVRVVKGYSAEAREEAAFASGIRHLLENLLSTMTTVSWLSFSSSALLGVVGAAVIFIGTRSILAGDLTVGEFFTFTMLLGFVISPLLQVVGLGTQLTEALAGLERTREVLREPREGIEPRRTLSVGLLRGDLEFREVHFAYPGSAPVLHGISFRAAPGSVTALVGPSGAGKSTVSGLIAAFHCPSSGEILVDGVDLSQVRLDTYRSQLGVVFQETFLFDGTIRENVLFPRPDADDADVRRAGRLAGVDDFALSFERGYDTIVGERGVKLSGGQRQRVAIARAIMADPRILILDEATSSLDSESEARIQAGLKYLMKGRTSIVIAHRLSTIRSASQILVLDEGRIVERGTHAKLLEARGRYYDMHARQHSLAQNLFLAPGEEVSAAENESAAGTEDQGTGAESTLDVLRRY